MIVRGRCAGKLCPILQKEKESHTFCENGTQSTGYVDYQREKGGSGSARTGETDYFFEIMFSQFCGESQGEQLVTAGRPQFGSGSVLKAYRPVNEKIRGGDKEEKAGETGLKPDPDPAGRVIRFCHKLCESVPQ